MTCRVARSSWWCRLPSDGTARGLEGCGATAAGARRCGQHAMMPERASGLHSGGG